MFSTDSKLAETIQEPPDIIYLDANHTYSHAIRDIEICDNLIPPNGLVFFDDVGPEASPQYCTENRGGVRQALLDYTNRRGDLQVIFFEPPFWLNPCGMAVMCKQQPATGDP